MQLPDIPMGPVQDEVSPALEHEAAAARGLGSVIEQGLTQYGQEVVKTQTIDAHLKLSQGIDQLENELKTKKAYSLDELKARLGDRYSQLPPELLKTPDVPVLQPVKDPRTGQMTMQPVIDPTTGQQKMRTGDVPTFAVADVLYKARASELLEQAKAGITVGRGWQSNFERAATGDLISRFSRLNEYQLQQAHQQQVDQTRLQVLSAGYSGDFGLAKAIIASKKAVLGEDGQQQLSMHVLGLEQQKPVYDALTAFHSLPPGEPVPNKVKQDLADAQKRVEDPGQLLTMDPLHRDRLAKRVETALKQAEDLGKGAALKDEARRELNDIVIRTKGDPLATATAIRQIGRTDLADEVNKRFRETMAEDEQTRKVSDEPRVARLESTIDQVGSLDMHGDDYVRLSDEGKARVDAKFRAAIRSQRAEGSEERRQQHEIDMTREAEFDALPLAGVPGKDQTSADIRALYPDVSPLGQARIFARQKKSAMEWHRDQGVSHEAFTQQARAIADALHYPGNEKDSFSKRGQFIRAMQAERDSWFEANPLKKAMPPEEEKRIFKTALDSYDPSWPITPSFLSSADVAGWQLKVSGKEEKTKSKKQLGLEAVDRVLGGGAPAPAPGTPSAASKAAPARKAGDLVQGADVGQPADYIFQVQPSGKLKRVK